MIVIFSDFGSHDIYLGQVKAILNKHVANVTVIDLFNDAPVYNIPAAAHLLAALNSQFPAGTVFLSVVDPGVGSTRAAIVVNAGDKWFIGPDNGLISVVAQKLGSPQVWEIVWKPERYSVSFHGRDLFAPIAGQIASGNMPYEKLKQLVGLGVNLDSGPLREIIYIDHYGNAFTGILSAALSENAKLRVGNRSVSHSRIYTEVAQGEVFWYENSIGLVEIAANCASATKLLGLDVGERVEVVE